MITSLCVCVFACVWCVEDGGCCIDCSTGTCELNIIVNLSIMHVENCLIVAPTVAFETGMLHYTGFHA